MNPGSMTEDVADIKRQQDEASRYGITVMAYHLTLSSGAITEIKSTVRRLRLPRETWA